MIIELRIDRLVLDGLALDARAAGQIAAAIEAELASSLAAGSFGATARPGAIPVLRTAPVELPEQSEPHLVGRSIARSVTGGLNHDGRL